MKKIISIILALAICMSFGTAAFADSNDFYSAEGVMDNEGQPRFIRTAKQTITTHKGIELEITYTFNDSDGSFTGVQDIVVTYCPDNVYSINITNYTVANSYILFQLTYWEYGVCKSDSAYLYPM